MSQFAQTINTIATNAVALATEPQGMQGNGPRVSRVTGSSIGIACRSSQSPRGAEIISVIKDSPAGLAKLGGQAQRAHSPLTDHGMTGDVITAVMVKEGNKEKRIKINSSEDLEKCLASHSAGDSVRFEYVCSRTNIKSMSKSVQLAPARGTLGIDFDTKWNADSLSGHRVKLGDFKDLPAARAGLKDNDLITSITVHPQNGSAPFTLKGEKAVNYIVPGGERKGYKIISIDQYADLIPSIKAGDKVTMEVVRCGKQIKETYGGVLGFFTKERTVTPIEKVSLEMTADKRASGRSNRDVYKL